MSAALFRRTAAGKRRRRQSHGMAIAPTGNRRRTLRPGNKPVPIASRTRDFFGNDTLPGGFEYKPDFLSQEEEQSLLQHIVPLPFREFEFQGFTGKRRIVSFGWRYDFNGGGLLRRRFFRCPFWHEMLR